MFFHSSLSNAPSVLEIPLLRVDSPRCLSLFPHRLTHSGDLYAFLPDSCNLRFRCDVATRREKDMPSMNAAANSDASYISTAVHLTFLAIARFTIHELRLRLAWLRLRHLAVHRRYCLQGRYADVTMVYGRIRLSL